MRRTAFGLALLGLAVATAPACPADPFKWEDRWTSRVQPITSPLVYADHCLVISSPSGVAIIDFHEEVAFGVKYRFRCWDLTREKDVSGDGRLYDKPQSADKAVTVAQAGPLGLDWSYSGAGRGWVYWWPETGYRVEAVRRADYHTLDLKRFVRP